MNRSKRITRVYTSIPKLRVRGTNEQHDNGYEIPSTSNNVLTYNRTDDVNLPSEELTELSFSHTPLSNEVNIKYCITYKNNIYIFPIINSFYHTADTTTQ